MAGTPLFARLCYLLIFLQSCHNVLAMPLDPLAISAEPAIVPVLPDEQSEMPVDLSALTLPKNMSPNPLYERQVGLGSVEYDCGVMPHICAENCFAIICQGAPRTLTNGGEGQARDTQRRGLAGANERPFAHKSRRNIDYGVTRLDDTCISAEEYPPASSREGGSGSIIGGVPIREQSIQGGRIRGARLEAGQRYQVKFLNPPPGSICHYLDDFVSGQLSEADRERICNDRGPNGVASYAGMAYTAISALGKIIGYNQAWGAKP